MATVWHAFYDVLRHYGMTTMFGNPGSTEQSMLQNFPDDFRYIFGLQEASVLAMAGGFAEATRKPVLVSLHTSPGTGNAMGNLVTAFITRVPLVIVAGQQRREMLLGEPMLANRDAAMLPRPYVKWSYEPVRAVDVPSAIVRAISTAMQPPMGPVYVSVPWGDWNERMGDVTVLYRSVSTRFGPDPARLKMFADKIRACKKPALVLGGEVDRSLAWPQAVKLAETLQCPTFQAPMAERAVFPETHDLFRGPLPTAQAPLAEYLKPFDLVLVVGAEVFRYYPWVPGPVLYGSLLQITEDPHDAAKALMGDSLLSDVGLALDGLNDLLKDVKRTATQHPHHRQDILDAHPSAQTMTAFDAFSIVAALRPADAILVYETPSNSADLLHAWPSTVPESCFTFASGGLGWNAPSAVGIALAQKSTGRVTVAVIGDGSFQYSLQSIYTAVQQKVKLIYLIPVNEQYAVLKEFAVLEETPNVPGLDIPGLNISATALAFGCPAYRAHNGAELKEYFLKALNDDGPSLIEFPIDRTLRPLIAQTASGA
ncbi:hypothetical protein AMS68_005198 [Peltaster fructicola]|uniref:Uncharacterized protein n=1 Tax=Peltaster fructicola TaxID=286661 RepID=A0A6H0XYE2_9PEZI|nr:hypothetical protein AMS68_005198 [Peltaster fructicola]